VNDGLPIKGGQIQIIKFLGDDDEADEGMMRKLLVILTLSVLLSVAMITPVNADGVEQAAISPTPFRVTIPTAAPPSTAGTVVTERPTATPTEQGPPQLTVREGYGDVNVRADPDIESDVMGKIRAGDLYTVTGRYYRWLQIRFEPATNHIGYVYDDLVEIVGDEADVPDLTILPTADNPAARATETWAAILSTPGGEMTVTADARLIVGVNAPAGAVGAEGTSEVVPASVLPTFTYPPNVVAQAPTDAPQMEASPTDDTIGLAISVSEGIAPIYPILILAGLGVLSFLLGILFRK
jgi:hypothetical protein